ncbi:pyridoxamine 5'-phosphate oxidase family protein [Arcobacter sp. LA11]|uniref:pyridoxamine 5'-phosphate oxidase family protein n=1 Tax=Arcobacter sp. LA11 TaxID=1898176 RepID=UPI00093304DA|nr:pyridoxamine 5'-phosphate oxidase family protein [Arcobacter sp. LA11]
MSSIYHEGEYYIQEKMGVRKDSDSLSSMIRDTIPSVAANFLKTLNFSVLVISSNEKDLFSTVVYDINSFIEIKSHNEILIKLNNHSYIPEDFFNIETLNIGFIGLDFEQALRIRINGKAKLKDNQLFVTIEEIYSNCPKYIQRRVLKKQLERVEAQVTTNLNKIKDDINTIISNSDTFFLGSFHKIKGLDISHKGGKRGFVNVLSSKQLSFEDRPGNNLYNSLGNIHTNPYISMFFIDFKRNNTYHIKGKAEIEEIVINEKKRLRVIIEINNITKNLNSFLLNYIEKT